MRYDDLPILDGCGLPHAWKVHGSADQLGTLNRLTPEKVVAAAGAVRTGERIGLTLPIEMPDPPMFGRDTLRHRVFREDRNTWDDRLDGFSPQASTQWDGLRHVRAREDGFYGGWQGDPDTDPAWLGIHHWARQGIVGRGILLDLAADHGLDPFEPIAFSAGDLEGVLRNQGTTMRDGDILCIRVGWVEKYLSLDAAGQRSLARQEAADRAWAGLSGGDDMARFLWDCGAAAVLCDNPAVEVAPGDPAVGSLHRRLIPCLGFALGELFDLSSLAAACSRDGHYDFLFASVPLPVTGGVGSPGTAVAIR